MRITGGTHSGRIIEAPKGKDTRPTSDRVRESLFNVLAPDIDEADFLDCFSGTGAVGLEALSRGAASAVLVEQNSKAVAVIRKNASKLGLSPVILSGDFFKIADKLHSGKSRFDIIFVDPPYMDGVQIASLEKIQGAHLLKKGGRVIVEHDKRESLPGRVGELEQYDMRTYGETILSFYSEGQSIA